MCLTGNLGKSKTQVLNLNHYEYSSNQFITRPKLFLIYLWAMQISIHKAWAFLKIFWSPKTCVLLDEFWSDQDFFLYLIQSCNPSIYDFLEACFVKTVVLLILPSWYNHSCHISPKMLQMSKPLWLRLPFLTDV